MSTNQQRWSQTYYLKNETTIKKRSRERMAKKRSERIVAGLCPQCGKQPPSEGRKQCAVCIEKAKTYPSYSLERAAAQMRRYRAERKAAGLCPDCGKQPPVKGRRLCATCAEKRQACAGRYRKQKNSLARKRHANNPHVNVAKTARYRARKVDAAGFCSVEQIRARWDYYDGLCYLCGGLAETMDHVIPLSAGGTNWPANLRPACSLCNSRKTFLPLGALL